MRFAERALIMMCLIGYYLATWRRPPDVSVLFVAAGALSVVYVLAMPLLLAGIAVRELRYPEVRRRLRWQHWVGGCLFGGVSAYCVFSICYHSLGQMDRLALVENCGLGLVLFTALAAWRRRREPGPFYPNMLRRIAVLAALGLLSLLLHPAG